MKRLSLIVLGCVFEDANGERVIAVDSDQLDLKRKVWAALQ
jgi:hypothetical protein